jgi:hypothetical protein
MMMMMVIVATSALIYCSSNHRSLVHLILNH